MAPPLAAEPASRFRPLISTALPARIWKIPLPGLFEPLMVSGPLPVGLMIRLVLMAGRAPRAGSR